MGRNKKYDPPEVTEALTCFALGSGRPERVKELLAELNLGHIPVSSISTWAYRDEREQYERIKSDLDVYVRSRMVDRFAGLADKALDLQVQIIAELQKRLGEKEIILVPTRELKGLLHEAVVAAGHNIENSQLLAGKPTQITRMDLGDLRKQLKERHGVELVLEGEIVDEEDVTPEQLPAST